MNMLLRSLVASISGLPSPPSSSPAPSTPGRWWSSWRRSRTGWTGQPESIYERKRVILVSYPSHFYLAIFLFVKISLFSSDDHLRLHCKDLLQRPHLPHLWLTFLNPWQPRCGKIPLRSSKFPRQHFVQLQPTRSRRHRPLPLHHGLPRGLNGQLWRGETSLEDSQVGHPSTCSDARRPHGLCPWGQSWLS